MKYLCTLFDYNHSIPLPLQSLYVSGDIVKFYDFYMPGSGLKIKQIKQNLSLLRELFSGDICINDSKSHIMALDIQYTECNIYDTNMPLIKLPQSELLNSKKILAVLIKDMLSRNPMKWNNLLADASMVYAALESRGVHYGYKLVYPHYDLNTFTGRSKTLGFNLQGTTNDFDINHTHDEFQYFIHFDWLAADIRMAAYLSGDPILNNAFINSDPYSMLASITHKDRNECKSELIRSMYSMSFDNHILSVLPFFKKWMVNNINDMRINGYTTSAMGRLFKLTKDNELSVFNAQFQGSVAHAMQATLVNLSKVLPLNVLTEVHDSVIMCTDECSINKIIKIVVEIMINPLSGLINDSPRMPIKVSIGNKWRQWKLLRVYR